MKSTLRPHQADAIDRLRQSLASGKRRPIVQAPTGFGKTIVAAAIVEMARKKGKRVVFCAPAISLIDQTVEAFYREGIDEIGVIQADHPMTDPSKSVQVASVQTLEKRQKPDCDLVIVDECHRMFKSMNAWMAEAAQPFVGLSATPWAKGLGRHYDDLIIASTTEELISKGFLSPFKVFAPAHPDLSDVRINRGEFHEGDLAAVMNQKAIIADVVATWARLGDNRPTIAFCVDRAHAQNVQADFEACGIRAEYIDAFTSMQERKNIQRRLEAGDVKVVASVGCLTTGVDWDVRCLIMARPTRSDMLFVQMIGRGLRTAPGKSDLIVLDHADNHARLGFVTDIHHDTLNGGIHKAAGKTKPRREAPMSKECLSCSFLMPAKVRQCPSCGTQQKALSEVEIEDGELAEFGRNKSRSNAKEYTREEKQRWYSSLLWIAHQRGYAQGWVSHKYKEKFGVWPQALYADLVEPAADVLSWIRSRNIKWAKSKRNRDAHNAA